MANTPANVRNYFKLDLVIARSYEKLRQVFKNRYLLFTGGQVWDDSPTCGANYAATVSGKNKKLNLTAVQKTLILNGDSNEWDLTILTALLLYTDRPKTLNVAQIQQLDDEDKLIAHLRDIRNHLAHHASKNISDVEFNQLWSQLTAILAAFGDTNIELDKLKDDKMFESSTQLINEENVKELLRLNSLGTQAHKEQMFSDAITLFTKAVVITGVSDHDRAIVYTNMSSSRLALHEQQPSAKNMFDKDDPTDQRYRALRDAKQARSLWSTSWKGHFRVGQVYATLNDHEKAIISFGRALALDPQNTKIQEALSDSRQIQARQTRQEHLDPRVKPTTMHEHLNELKQKLGIEPENVRLVHGLLDKVYPSGADVVKGHKYFHGDIDVKQDYEQAAKYFAKAASQGNAEGIYNLGLLTDRGLGVKMDHKLATELFEKAASQSPQHPIFKGVPNLGVVEAEHALGLRYADGVHVHKNLSIAAQWYQRAIDHGSALSANNLALLYQDGLGVGKDPEKARILLELSAKRGDLNAMLTLAELLLNMNDLKMAKIWYDRACEAGNVVAQANRDQFGSFLRHKEQIMAHCPADVLQMANETKSFFDSFETENNPNKLTDHKCTYDYNVLKEHAKCGSLTAKKLCNALQYFRQGLSILTQSQTLTKKQENRFVYEWSQCCRIERTVAQTPNIDMHRKIEEIVERVLQRCCAELNSVPSQLDEDVRVCYASLHMDSHELILQFLGPCKQKYPQSIYFIELSAVLNGRLDRHEASLYDCNIGLDIDPNYTELLYQKAVSMNMLARDPDEIIEAYRAFLVVAPEDHHKVPESYYVVASFYLVDNRQVDVIDTAKKTYEQGEESEKKQLPCYLPYKSNTKKLLQYTLDTQSSSSTVAAAPPPPFLNRKTRLTDPHRIEIIKNHREWAVELMKMKESPNRTFFTFSQKPRIQQQAVKSLVGLKLISLREMDPAKDHIYSGYVLSVIIIEKAYAWNPSIHLVIEDEHFDCERMVIYGFGEGQGEYLINEVFTIGSKMNIINPYLRLGANDMKPLIRVDDFSSIIMQGEGDRVQNMCRCCGEPNAPSSCVRCQQARYCTKECQIMDWEVYKHKLICKKL